MQIFKNILDINIDIRKYCEYSNEECLFFDIETTGFSAKTTRLYLIGCIYYKESAWNYIQWFAEAPIDEGLLIDSFLELSKDFKALIHFNGDGFDIPYLEQKCARINKVFDISHIKSIDIFKIAFRLKKYLKLENYKQKTIEKFLGISREDKYSGGELIDFYSDYLKTKNPSKLALLLLHNLDDLKGLIQLLPILSYNDFINASINNITYEINEKDFIITAKLDHILPARISYGVKSFYITAYKDVVKIKVDIYCDELKYFYSNYKDYYYLPVEDMAIHKSVAFFVDKDYRTKAKAANCYSKKTGNFVPQINEIVPTYFKAEYNDKTMYIELSDDFLRNDERMMLYVKDIILNL